MEKNMTGNKYLSSCNMVWEYSLGAEIVLAGAAVFLTAGLTVQLATGADALAVMKTLFLLYLTGMFILVSNHMRIIFGELRKSETPFFPDIAEKMKKLAAVLILGAVLANLFPITGVILRIPGSSVFALSYIINAVMLIMGNVFNAFVFVFEHGYRLQKESDETL